MERYDYLVVGAGFSGCVVAERIASQLGKRVLLVEKQNYLGGLAHDFVNEHGVLVHTSGLHVFHTHSEDVFAYLSRFTEWCLAKTRVAAAIDGRIVPFPFNRDSLNALFGLALRSDADVEAYLRGVRVPIAEPANAEEMALSQVGEGLYRKFFEGYTRKWWGIEPSRLDARVTSRIKIRPGRQLNYQADRFQGVPRDGYARMFARMVDHPNITVALGTDYRAVIGSVPFDRMVFTGAIDEFFDYEEGRLPYRAMRFEYRTFDTEYVLPVHQVIFPNAGREMRIFEFKHATLQRHPKTTVIYEYPIPWEPGLRQDYPMPIAEGEERYQRYVARAARLPSVVFLGRLAQYRYYTMGQTVARALTTFQTRIARSVLPEDAPAALV